MDHWGVISSSVPNAPLDVDEILRDILQFGHSLHHQLLHDLLSDYSSLQQILRTSGSSLRPLRNFDQLIRSNPQPLCLTNFDILPWHGWSKRVHE